jgi:hypothetical protein
MLMESVRWHLVDVYAHAGNTEMVSQVKRAELPELADVAYRYFFDVGQRFPEKRDNMASLVEGLEWYYHACTLEGVPLVVQDPKLLALMRDDRVTRVAPFQVVKPCAMMAEFAEPFRFLDPVDTRDEWDILFLTRKKRQVLHGDGQAPEVKDLLSLALFNSKDTTYRSCHFTPDYCVIPDSMGTANLILQAAPVFHRLLRRDSSCTYQVLKRSKPSAKLPFKDRHYFHKLCLVTLAEKEAACPSV